MERLATVFDNKYLRFTAITVIFLLFLFESTYNLTENPPTWTDEGWYGQTAYNLLDTGKISLRTSPTTLVSGAFSTGGFPMLYPVAAVLELAGKSLLSLRIGALLFLIAFFWLVFFFAKKLWGFWPAIFVILIVFSYPSIYGNGKNLLGEIPGLFYAFLSFFAIRSMEMKSGSWQRGLLGGVCVGLAAATKPILIPFAGAALLVIFLKYWRSSSKTVLYFILGCVISGILWIITQFNANDPAGEILFSYANPYALSNLLTIIGRNLLRFLTEQTPVYFLTTLTIWFFSIVARLRSKSSIYLYEWAAAIYSILVLLAYLRTPGWYRYLFIGLIINLFFAAGNFTELIRLISNSWQKFSNALRFVPPILFICLFSLQFAGLFRGSFIAQSYTSHKSELLSSYMKTISSKKSFYIFGSPELVLFLPNTQNYYQLIANEPNDIGRETLTQLKNGVPDIVGLNAGNYEPHKELFVLYKRITKVGPYIFLEK